MSDGLWQVITGAIILGILVLLVKPDSPGPQAIKSVSDALTALVKTATGNNASGGTTTV